MASTIPKLAVTYEEPGGYFDKDEQGWCATNIAITQVEDRVRIRRWFDANGSVRSEEVWEGTVGATKGTRVTIVLDGGGTRELDLETQRLI